MATYTEVMDKTGRTVGFIMSLENRGEIVADEDTLVDGKLPDKTEYSLKEGGVRFYVDRKQKSLTYVSSTVDPRTGREILAKYGLSIKDLFFFPEHSGGARRRRHVKTHRRRHSRRHSRRAKTHRRR